ncbi:hypothetical protein K456DRAFT_1732319 [Colletotrichum gloeosporioides 23]|nr:hypothetical protein K456DRAFT_1732319 [Colletotrichum gloeosporioides 23]KAJ0283170.1 hypothetical protein COL940_004765 [Colletotrichum noveboracense]KAJ0317474.1 hypothetical protein Brms1b_004874 [Colletotrichum noveboracense]
MRSTTLLVVALTTLASGVNGVRAAANLCFFPGGVQSLDVPCDPKAEVSMCCGSVNACLSNGLCKLEDTSNNTGIAYARGTCSDPTWQSPICPQNCVLNPDTRKNNSAFDFRFNGVQVWQCDSQGFATPGKFCCESAAEKTRCCSTPAAIFGPLIAATPGNAAAVQTLNTNSKSTPTQSASGSHKTGGTAAEATGPGHTPAITSAPTMTSKIPASTPAAGSGTGATTGETTSGTTEKQGLSTVATVGMGVGASVGGALLVAVGVMWWMRKERRERGPVELDGSSVYGAGGNGGDLSRANSGRIAYGGMNVGNGTGTISSMGTGTYVNGMGTMGGRRASSEWDGSPGGLGGSYQMAEIDGKEALVVGEPKGRKKSLYELP